MCLHHLCCPLRVFGNYMSRKLNTWYQAFSWYITRKWNNILIHFDIYIVYQSSKAIRLYNRHSLSIYVNTCTRSTCRQRIISFWSWNGNLSRHPIKMVRKEVQTNYITDWQTDSLTVCTLRVQKQQYQSLDIYILYKLTCVLWYYYYVRTYVRTECAS